MKDVDAPGRLVGSGRYADVYDIGRGRRHHARLLADLHALVHGAEAVRIRRLLRSARLADRPRR